LLLARLFLGLALALGVGAVCALVVPAAGDDPKILEMMSPKMLMLSSW
jgi:hypothetical protein